MHDDDLTTATSLTGTFFWTEDLLWDKQDTPEVLRDAARNEIQADIALREGALRGTFARVTDRRVEFKLDDASVTNVKTASLCCVSFQRDGKPCFFLSVVEGLDKRSSRAPTLQVACPSQLEGPEWREGVRVRTEDDALVARLHAGAEDLGTVQAVELGLTDLLVAFPTEEAADLMVGTRIRVELTLGDLSTKLDSEVQRRKGRKIGLRLLDETGVQAVNASPALLNIIVDLENRWFQRRRASWMMLFGRGPLPHYSSHEEALCAHCGDRLANCHSTLNRPGFGQFVGDCKPCRLFTWYDLD